MTQEKFNPELEPENKNLPIGVGKEFFDKRKETELPVAEIKNSVSWVNPAFKEVPFKLAEGQPAKLGLFFTTGNSEKKLSIAPEYRTGRSGMIDPVIFRDTEGRLYRDVDLKGIGAFRRDEPTNEHRDDTFMVVPPEILQDDQYQNAANTYELGIVGLGYAINDRDRAEELLKNGIRTYRIVAFIDLEEIIDKDGNKVSIEEAKNRKLMRKNTKPVIEVRAFTTRERIDYLSTQRAKEDRIQLALEDARMLVAQELGVNPSEFLISDYTKWFAETLGKQLAQLEKLGLYHGYLHSQNITLDCKIIDLDSVKETQEFDKFAEDFSDTLP